MQIFRPTIWLGLLALLLCSLAAPSPAFCLSSGRSCLTAWNGDDCPQPCALSALQAKSTPCPNCHHHRGLPQPLKAGQQLLNPLKRLDHSTFIPLGGGFRDREPRTPPPQLLPPRRPLLPNQTLAALRTVVLLN